MIGGQYFCVHGGLSPSLPGVDGLFQLNRKEEVPQEGVITDLLWSDPEESIEGWEKSGRGAGFLFGKRVVKEFHHLNGTKCLVRSHQLVHDGYRYLFKESLLTVWSSPNYCYSSGNIACIMELDEENKVNFLLFEEAPSSLRPVDKEYRKWQPAYFTF
jgi:serine/threonine-protein phosphatase 4 catalytic subunit